ncbi:MAG: hypothetical protein H7141_08275 [Burkholderiales bacterium]|nr:hypothetical protein [Bacteroidia bacterium]
MFRFFFFLLALMSASIKAQDLNFTSQYYTWPNQNKSFDVIPDSLKDDAVILADDIDLNFPEKYIKRRQSVKILNEQGLNYFSSINLPQNFDITQINNSQYKQGRFSNRTIPFIYDYKILYFALRIIRDKAIIEIPLKVTTAKVYWVKNDGERIYDYEYRFSFDNLAVNDIIEYTYKAEIKGSYDSDQFYVNDYYPKLKTNLTIKVKAPGDIKSTTIILNNNIDSALYKRTDVPDKNFTYQNHVYKFKNLKAIKYSQNSLAGKTLPHVTANIYALNRYFFNQTMNSTKYLYATKYMWFVIPDSMLFKEKVYDKYGASLRKFVSGFPDNANDTSKVLFYNQIIDTLNLYKFLPSEQLHYGKEAQYSLTSSERLLKRQLAEEFIGDTYSDILFEKNIFYYRANIQDRRLGMHSTAHRAHEYYETEFIALPVKNSFKFYVPRFNGLKYFPDELPFYYEGNLCALFPKNTKAALNKSESQNLKFIRTPISTYNENIRTENAMFKVNTDSSIIHAFIKENISGQFSTILRPFYNNDHIDSTIKNQYYKKCVEKPNSNNKSVKQTAQSKTFPFKTSYSCSENIDISKDHIDLSNWFSFLFSKESFSDKITQDYYLDFTFTDTYNFLFEFNKPTTIVNMADFITTITNEFFEINTNIIRQDDSKYLLTVNTKAKQYLLPEAKVNYLKDYTEQLGKINSFKLKLSN